MQRPITRLGLAACLAALAACGPKPLILKGPRFPARAPLDEVMKEAGKPAAAAPPTAPANKSAPIRLAAGVANADWPQRMGGPTHYLPPLALGAQLTEAWAAPIGQPNDKRHQITATPVVAGGRIYTIDSRSNVSATSTAGAHLWTADLTPRGLSPDAATGGGLAYGAGLLFASTGFGDLKALDPASGKEVWSVRFHAAVSGTPTVEGGVVYVVTRDSKAWALDTATGKIRWQIDNTNTGVGMPGAAGPALSARFALLPFPSGVLAGALKPGGTQLWTSTVAGKRLGEGYAISLDITGDPVVVGDRVFVANGVGTTQAVTLNTGETIWSAPEGAVNPVWPAGGSVFLVSDQGKLVRLDAATGERIWAVDLPFYVPVKRVKNRGTVFANFGPILAGGRLIVASSDGRLMGFDPVDGHPTGTVTLPAGAASEPVVAGRTFYVVTVDGQLRAFR